MPKPTLKERLKAHFAEYGRVAIWVYLVMSLMTITGFSIAIWAGVEPSSATGVLGVIGAGWLASKATMPIRILVTLAITPPIAALIVRRKAKRAIATGEGDPTDDTDADAPVDAAPNETPAA